MQFPDRASRLRRPRPTGSAGPPAEAFPVPSPTGSIALHLPLISSQPDSFLPCVDIYHTGFGYVYLFKGHYTSSSYDALGSSSDCMWSTRPQGRKGASGKTSRRQAEVFHESRVPCPESRVQTIDNSRRRTCCY